MFAFFTGFAAAFAAFFGILKQKYLLLLKSLFTILFLSFEYKSYSLCCAILVVVFQTLNSLKKDGLICKEKEPMKEANDSETSNLRVRPLTRDEIRYFANRLRITPKDENNREELRVLKQNLYLNLNINI